MKKLHKWYEKYNPILFSSLILLLIYKFDSKLIYNLSFSLLSETTLVVFSVLLGFLLTITTLLHTINNRKMDLLKGTGHYSVLMNYLKSSIYFSLTLFLFSLIYPIYKSSMFVEIINSNGLSCYFKYSFLYILFHSIFSTIRFIRLFIRLVSEKKRTMTKTLKVS